MNCDYHPDREVVGMCVSCGKPICVECKVILKDKIYCNQCIDTGKAKVIYDKYKIETKALTPVEFVNDISPKLNEKLESKYLFNAINTTIKNGFVHVKIMTYR